MEQSTQTEMSFTELTKDIYAKLDNIQTVLGFILEKTNLIPIKTPHKGVDNGFKYQEENKILEEVNASENPQDA